MVVTPPVRSADRWYADQENMLRRCGVILLLAYGFVRFSFLSDIANHIIGSKPFLVMGLGVPTATLMLMSGGIRRTFRARPAYFLVALMLWLVIVVPLSFWIGGSIKMLVPAFETEFSMLFLLAGLLLTRREVDWFLSVLALSGAFVILVSFYYGVNDFDRFGFSFGTLQNANDYATHLLLLIPFLLLVVFNSSSLVLRILAGIFALLGAGLVVRTGSRGALLALIVMLGFAFLKSNMTRRAGIAVTMVASGLVLLFVIRPDTLGRYMTLVDSSVEQEAASSFELGRAVNSSEQRKDLLRDSLTLTALHPLFGVGPGMFAASAADRAKEQGKRAAWLLTHNSYTEISSESGIPGFLLFVCIIVSNWFLVRSVYVRANLEARFAGIRNTAFCMMVSFLGFCISIFFSSISYRYYLPSLVGLTIAFSAAAQREMNSTCPPSVLRSTLHWPPRNTH
jgi:O-antigen ligase